MAKYCCNYCRNSVLIACCITVEDFNVGGLLNGLPITEVLSHLILLDNGGHPQYLYVNLDVQGNVTFNDDATIGSVNGVNPPAYFASVRF